MPFQGIVDPDKLAALSRLFEAYCAENGIGPDHPDRNRIAHRIMALFTAGVSTVDQLASALKDADGMEDF